MLDWTALLETYGPLVWKTVWRLVRHDADAADCFQNTFVAAWREESRRAIQSWPAFLTHLATVQALERLRQRARRTQPQRLPAISLRDAKAVPPEELFLQQEGAELLRQALATLEERQATVFCLACVEEMSYDQIAVQCSLSLSHVGVLLHRAKAALRQRLREYHDPMLTETST
jgi:RNA polymerase sigma-70 factor (ECF subfamily)